MQCTYGVAIYVARDLLYAQSHRRLNISKPWKHGVSKWSVPRWGFYYLRTSGSAPQWMSPLHHQNWWYCPDFKWITPSLIILLNMSRKHIWQVDWFSFSVWLKWLLGRLQMNALLWNEYYIIEFESILLTFFVRGISWVGHINIHRRSWVSRSWSMR